MRMLIRTHLVSLLLMVSTNCGEGELITFQGKYVADFDVGGGTYRTTFMFTDSTFIKEFSFIDEDELVWRCTGSYAVKGNMLLRGNRVCEFLRAEEPTPPEVMQDIAGTIKDLTDTSFVLCFEKGDNSVPDTSICLKFLSTTRGRARE